MNEIWDIYNKSTFALVAGDVPLNKKRKHRKLTDERYMKLRTGKLPPLIDTAAMAYHISTLRSKVSMLEYSLKSIQKQIERLQYKNLDFMGLK